MYKNCVIMLMYDKEEIGQLFINTNLDILGVQDYVDCLITNYNTHLINYTDKNSYEFIANFLMAADINGKHPLNPSNLKERSLKKYNSIYVSNPYENMENINSVIGLIPYDIKGVEDDYEIEVFIDLYEKKINIKLYDPLDKYLYIEKVSEGELDVIHFDYDITNIPFNDITDAFNDLDNISKNGKILRENGNPGQLLMVK